MSRRAPWCSWGFRLSRRPPSELSPWGLEHAEDLAGVGIAVVIWASAAFAGFESIRKLLEHGHTSHVAVGIAGAAIGIIGNQLVARYKMVVGKRINSATLIADARHSWLDALSSAGALAGLVAVALGQSWGDPVAGLAVTAFICHVGYEVTSDVLHRLADGVDPEVIPQPRPPPDRCPGSSTPMPGPGGPGGPCGWKSRAGSILIFLPVMPMPWAARSLTPFPGSSRRRAASPGRPGPHPPDRPSNSGSAPPVKG